VRILAGACFGSDLLGSERGTNRPIPATGRTLTDGRGGKLAPGRSGQTVKIDPPGTKLRH
jgi:hypothetical protein